MTDLALVAAGITAAMPQTHADLSPRHSATLRLQEEQLIQAVLNAPSSLQPFAQLQPIQREALPQFSAAPSSNLSASNLGVSRLSASSRGGVASPGSASSLGSTAPEVSSAAQRARIEVRLRQLERSALAQMPGATVSFDMLPERIQPEWGFSPSAQPAQPAPRLKSPVHRIQQQTVSRRGTD